LNRRAELLGDLLMAARPIAAIAEELREFGWDSDEELVILDRTHVIAILDDYLAGRREAPEVCSWAEAIEGRDDIGLAEECHTVLKDVIFQLANPGLGCELSPLLARKLIGDLRRRLP
jgi:hypothetical protein